MKQVTLDFASPRPLIQESKKEKRLPVAVSEELKQFVELMAARQGTSASELSHRYIVKGLSEDVANTFMPEPHLDKTLRELMAKFSHGS